MWEKLGHNKTLAYEPWPTYDPSKLDVNTCKMAVSVNGKVRGTIEIEKGSSDEAVKEAAFKLDGVIRHTEGKEIKKIIIIKDKIVNIVAI